jgi:hypothetical protein
MKILNDSAWNLNWIKVEMNWNLIQVFKFNLNTLNRIQIQKFKLIKEKWNTNWYRKYWKFSCDHGVARKNL